MAEEFVYIGRKPCGCVTCAAVDDPEQNRSVAREVAAMVKKGMAVTRVPIDEARTVLHPCRCRTEWGKRR